ncbi:MAG: hypothetical protein HYT12_04650 [Candidatus Liptonbacteria bacterium]|nr:hypothetical protein [Candidatus Liptonbacteria bacterium]
MATKKYTAKDVMFRPLSAIQKDDCINFRWCCRKAVQEAAVGVATIRCCNKTSCKVGAAQMAIDAANRLRQYKVTRN